ncbi:MAG: thiamine pyrophosphate-dependent enzyme [Terracidiphilus sp.]|jgi:TPP-dependent pyruvate/acetoin dehydrogenase alpha subunit
MTKSKTELAPADEGFSLISNRKLLTLYAAMVECRRIAEGVRGRRKRNGASSVLGHEATAVGAAIDLLADDTIVAGRWPEAALKAINPVVSVASSASRATRSTLAQQDSRKVTLLFSPSSASAQPSWLRALTQAADHNLPILFVSLPLASLFGPAAASAAPGAETVPTKRRGYAFPLIGVDGHDVVAVFRVASEAIAHARKGHGPTLIDCRITGPGDPLENMRKYLSSKGLYPG